MSGIVVEKTDPVSTRVQLDNGTVIRQHQDHVKSRKNDVVEESATSAQSNVAPSTPDVNNQLEVPKSPQAAPTQTPRKTSPPGTRPVWRRARPRYLKGYLCEQ